MKEKYFIITIDTEGDNLWNPGVFDVTTNNAQYLPRFQDLCEKYGFIPTWLTNYEMIMDDYFVDYFKPKAHLKLCEIGMHLHAWNSPPAYDLKEEANIGHPYLSQYPDDIMYQKIAELTRIIEERIAIRPTSHRAGRWVIDQRYISYLKQLGYTVDTSVTPHVNWKKAIKDEKATDYSGEREDAHFLENGLLEVPVTIRNMHPFHVLDRDISLRKRISAMRKFVKGAPCWIRPMPNTYGDVVSVYKRALKANEEVIVFMMHSSELMPGGSPYFETSELVEELYRFLEYFFSIVSKDYAGISLSDYAKTLKEEENVY